MTQQPQFNIASQPFLSSNTRPWIFRLEIILNTYLTFFPFLTTSDFIDSFRLCFIATRQIGQMVLGPFYQRANWVLQRLWQDRTSKNVGRVNVGLLYVSPSCSLKHHLVPFIEFIQGCFECLPYTNNCAGDSMLNKKDVVLNKKPPEELKTNKKAGNYLNCDRWKILVKDRGVSNPHKLLS